MQGARRVLVDVAGRLVGGRAVVPEGDVAGLPTEPHRVLGPGDLLEEQVEQALALVGAHVEDVAGEAGVDVERLLAGLGVHPHDRVVADEQLVALALPLGRHPARPGNPAP